MDSICHRRLAPAGMRNRLQKHFVIHPLRSLDTWVLIHSGQCVSSAVTVPVDEVRYGREANIRHSGV